VVIEGANGALCPIAVMYVRGNELEGGIPLEGDGFFVSPAGFVIRIWRSMERPWADKQVMIML
jgi:hypothetical protein